MKRSTKQNLSHGPRRVLCALLAAVFVLSLAGCGSGSASFTWFVDTIPSNLDPQVASTASDVIACENLYSGLVRKDASGKLVPALAEHWEVSSDRRTYTFTLKSGLTYTATKGAATDYAITAEDFVFAFRRMFRADTASPYAVEFSAIENSAAVLAGQLPETALGVQARGDATLVFCLSEPDENFLSKLTLPGAMPCDEDFFNSTRGTYGLSAASTLSSGSFYLYNWTASGLFLRREPSGNRIDSLRPDGRELRLTPTPDALDRPSAQVGFRPIPFEATTTDGRRVRFPEDFAGRYVLLDFWSLSCPPCLMDIRDHYLRDYAAYREAGFEILGVARNTDEDLRGNLPDLGIVWPVVADRPEGRITGCYRVDAYPTLYLIDPRGRIVAEGSDLRGERLSRWLRQAYPGVQPSPQTE